MLFRHDKHLIWRVSFDDIVKEPQLSQIKDAVTAQLDARFSENAPWSILETVRQEDGTYDDTSYLQVYRESGMQPAHWDTGLTWFIDPDNGKPWTGLSVLLNINDGLQPWLAKKGMPGMFHVIRRMGVAKAAACAYSIQSTLSSLYEVERVRAQPKLRRNRAGQCVAFHSGEHPHADTGFDGVADPLVPDWLGRVVAGFMAVPKKFIRQAVNNYLFSLCSEWGLTADGVQPEQVDLTKKKDKKKNASKIFA